MDRISVIIPTYNNALWLERSLDSLVGQTYSNIEIIVVNDGSKDDGATAAVARKYGDKIKISDPGYLGAVLLSCETDEFTVWDIVKEYEMEPLRGYFGRVADIRRNILAQE